ncbi:hypothetical protein ACVWZR_005311 [Bradyrhizobium sp. i1.3.1]
MGLFSTFLIEPVHERREASTMVRNLEGFRKMDGGRTRDRTLDLSRVNHNL